MNYLLISDFMWYLGHVLTGLSIVFTHNNYFVAVSLVGIGQFITILSRPIGRMIDNNLEKENDRKVQIDYIPDIV
jgi:hypothetical protein